MIETLARCLFGFFLGFLPLFTWWCGYHYGKTEGIRDARHAMKFLQDQTEKQSKQKEARDEKPVLVDVAIPLEYIGTVRCDFDGVYHVQVLGKEVVTDKETYRRVVEARDEHLRCVKPPVDAYGVPICIGDTLKYCADKNLK